MTDSELSLLIKESPQKAHRLLFDKYCNYVYAVVINVLGRCGTREDIEECVSDVFAKLFRMQEERDEHGGGSFKALAGTIARNTAIDYYRRLSPRAARTVSLEDEFSPEVSSELNIEAEAERSERRRILLDKIRALGEPDTSIIIQQYFYGRKAREIAASLEMTSAAVQKRSSRARLKLKELLIEAGIGKEDIL